MESIRLFLKEHKSDKKRLIILDNAPWHKKAVRLMREDKSFKDVDFLFLPPYSPELNQNRKGMETNTQRKNA